MARLQRGSQTVRIQGLSTPEDPTDAANMSYVDGIRTGYNISTVDENGDPAEVTDTDTANPLATQAYVDNEITNADVALIFQGDWDIDNGGYDEGDVVVGTGTATNNLIYQATEDVPMRVAGITPEFAVQDSTISGTITRPLQTLAIDAGAGLYMHGFGEVTLLVGDRAVFSNDLSGVRVLSSDTDFDVTGGTFNAGARTLTFPDLLLTAEDTESSFNSSDVDLAITNNSGQNINIGQVNLVIDITTIPASGLTIRFSNAAGGGFFNSANTAITSTGEQTITVDSVTANEWLDGERMFVSINSPTTTTEDTTFEIISISFNTENSITPVTATITEVDGEDYDLTFVEPDPMGGGFNITITGPASDEANFTPADIVDAYVTQLNASTIIDWTASRIGSDVLRLTNDEDGPRETWSTSNLNTEFSFTTFDIVETGVTGVTAIDYDPGVTVAGVDYWQELGGSSGSGTGSASTSFELEVDLTTDFAELTDIDLASTPPSGVLVAYNGVLLDNDEFEITTRYSW